MVSKIPQMMLQPSAKIISISVTRDWKFPFQKSNTRLQVFIFTAKFLGNFFYKLFYLIICNIASAPQVEVSRPQNIK